MGASGTRTPLNNRKEPCRWRTAPSFAGATFLRVSKKRLMPGCDSETYPQGLITKVFNY